MLGIAEKLGKSPAEVGAVSSIGAAFAQGQPAAEPLLGKPPLAPAAASPPSPAIRCLPRCQVVLRWAVQRGTSVTPKSTSEAHLRWGSAGGAFTVGQAAAPCLPRWMLAQQGSVQYRVPQPKHQLLLRLVGTRLLLSCAQVKSGGHQLGAVGGRFQSHQRTQHAMQVGTPSCRPGHLLAEGLDLLEAWPDPCCQRFRALAATIPLERPVSLLLQNAGRRLVSQQHLLTPSLLCALPHRMLDGGWFLSPEGPYRTLEELWDTESETATSGKA